MKSQLNIPKKIRVGCVERSDTYTKRLGYVIYYDERGKLRKETSFEGWRDKKIPAVDYDNIPTEGFVLNKKAGGYSSGWNQRATYCRIFDPRGFEFEISIPNLLFILQETNSIKGKGLEGEFVYSWEGKDIVLLPVTSQEYKQSAEFTSLKTLKIGKNEMVEGCTYLTKDQKEVVYLGKYNWYEMERGESYYDKFVSSQNKQHIFVLLDKIDCSFDSTIPYLLTKGFTGLAKRLSTDPISNFAEIFDKFAKSRFSNKPIGLETKPSVIKFPEINMNNSSTYREAPTGNYFLKKDENDFIKYSIVPIKEYEKNGSYYDRGKLIFRGYDLVLAGRVSFNNGILRTNSSYGRGYDSFYNRNANHKFYTQEELLNKGFINVLVKLEHGNKIEINNY